MRDFFNGRNFKILLALIIIVTAFMVRAAIDGSAASIITELTNLVTEPVNKTVSDISQGISDALETIFSGSRLKKENEDLREENAALREQLIDYELYRAENERLRDYLDIKAANPALEFMPAAVIGRDTADRFSSFTIDRGSSDGINADDPVITAEGMVGFVEEVTASSARVRTLLDVAVSVGAMDITTRDTGVTTGTVALSKEGLLRLSYLPRESKAKAGDLIVTTGIGGVCPKELVIGTVREVLPDSSGLSLYAVIEPPADIRSVTDVLVITSFSGEESR